MKADILSFSIMHDFKGFTKRTVQIETVVVMLYCTKVLIHVLNIKFCLSGIHLIQTTLALCRHIISFWGQDDPRTEKSAFGRSCLKSMWPFNCEGISCIRINCSYIHKTKTFEKCRLIGQGSSFPPYCQDSNFGESDW